MDCKFKTIFGTHIQVIKPSEEEIKETKASLSELVKILPHGINPEDDPDLLYIVGNLAVPGLVNLNDDYLTPEDAVATYKKFEKKLCDIEHNRSNIVGFIVKSYLTNFDNQPITDQEALESKQPFYITTIAALWKCANRELCDFIIEASNPAHPNYNKLSLSFEVGFYSYDIGVTSQDRNAINASFYNEDSEEYESYDKLLRINGGVGEKNNQIIFRKLKDGIIPLGQGIVGVPAAQVKGLEVLTENMNKIDSSEDMEDESEKESGDESGEDSSENSIEEQKKEIAEELIEEKVEEVIEKEITNEEFLQYISQIINLLISESKIFNKTIKNSVSNITNYNIMDKLEQLEKSWDEVKVKPSQEVFANVRQILAEEISKASEDFARKQEEAKVAAETLAKAKEDAEKAQKETLAQLEALRTELQSLRDAQVAAAKETEFNENMALIEQTFDFDEDETALVVAEVRDLDKESFAKWFEKSKKLMKEKTKSYKAEKKTAMEKKACDAGLSIEVDEKTLDFKQIIASAKQVESNESNVVSVEKAPSIMELAKKAFGPTEDSK